MKKKLYCILLSLAMVVTMMPMATMTVFGGTIVNIGDVLNTNNSIPTMTDKPVPNNAWKTGGGQYLYKSNDQTRLMFYDDSKSDVVDSVGLDKNVTISGDNYIYIGDFQDAFKLTITFHMANNVLNSIEYSFSLINQAWTDHSAANGTYTPPVASVSNWSLLAKAMKGEGSYENETTITDGAESPANLFKVKDTTEGGVTTRTITLLSDFTAEDGDSAFVVPADKKVVLDLNEHILDRGLKDKAVSDGNYGNVIRVGENASLTVKNGTITGSNAKAGDGALRGYKTTELNVNGVKFVDCKGGALYLRDVKLANIKGCTFTRNIGSEGGAIGADAYDEKDKIINITNCTFTENKATDGSGSAIHIFGNKTDQQGRNLDKDGNIGDVKITTYYVVNIIDSKFTENEVIDEDGTDASTICAYRLKSLLLDGCTITNNTAVKGYCAGFSIGGWTDRLTIKGKTIIKNNTVDGKPANMCLYNKDTTTFNVKDLDPKSQIGIKAKETFNSEVYVIVRGSNAKYKNCFFSDDPNYYINLNDNGTTGDTLDDCLELKKPASGNYAINVMPSENGTVTAFPNEASETDIVTLIVTPNSGYELETLTVKDADDADVTVTGNSFTMPDSAVTVSATFKAKETRTPTPGQTDNDEFEAYKLAQKTECDNLITPADSEAVKALLADAKGTIDNTKYDSNKSLAENKAVVDLVVAQFKSDIEQVRADEATAALVKAAKGKLIKATAYKNGKVKLTFKNLKIKNGARAVRYQVYRSTSKNFKKNLKKYTFKRTANTKNYTWTNAKKLKKNTKYYYKVRVRVQLADGSYVYTKWSNVKSIKCKKTR